MEKTNYRIIQTEPNEFILEKQIWTKVESTCNLEAAQRLLEGYKDLPKVIDKEPYSILNYTEFKPK